MSADRKFLRLRRVEQEGQHSSIYATLDGEWEIVKDPQSGNERGGWGYVSWLIYRKGEDEPLNHEVHPTLTAARNYLADHLSRSQP